MTIAYVPVTVAASLVAADIAATAHVPFEYYVATLIVLGAVLTIIRAWTWARSEMREIVIEEFRAHRADHQGLSDRVEQVIVPELNLGQLVWPVRAAVAGAAPVRALNRADGRLFSPPEIAAAVVDKEVAHAGR